MQCHSNAHTCTHNMYMCVCVFQHYSIHFRIMSVLYMNVMKTSISIRRKDLISISFHLFKFKYLSAEVIFSFLIYSFLLVCLVAVRLKLYPSTSSSRNISMSYKRILAVVRSSALLRCRCVNVRHVCVCVSACVQRILFVWIIS